MDNNGYIKLNGFKGIWTLESVVKLLQACEIKVNVSMGIKEDFILLEKDNERIEQTTHREGKETPE